MLAMELSRTRQALLGSFDKQISVAIAEGSHPFPSRTRKLSPPAPMVLGTGVPGRVGRCRISQTDTDPVVDVHVERRVFVVLGFTVVLGAQPEEVLLRASAVRDSSAMMVLRSWGGSPGKRQATAAMGVPSDPRTQVANDPRPAMTSPLE